MTEIEKKAQELINAIRENYIAVHECEPRLSELCEIANNAIAKVYYMRNN